MDRPIIFSALMVRAILSGRKSQTRMVIKPQPEGELAPIEEWSRGIAASCHDHNPDEDRLKAHADRLRGKLFPFRRPDGRLIGISPFLSGGTLWVKETWYCESESTAQDVMSRGEGLYYKATEEHPEIFPKWRPSISMPKWASRISLLVKDVRAQRLQDITEEDAIKEGMVYVDHGYGQESPGWNADPEEAKRGPDYCLGTARYAFGNLWNQIDKKHPWESNPYVWIISFEMGSEHGLLSPRKPEGENIQADLPWSSALLQG